MRRSPSWLPSFAYLGLAILAAGIQTQKAFAETDASLLATLGFEAPPPTTAAEIRRTALTQDRATTQQFTNLCREEAALADVTIRLELARALAFAPAGSVAPAVELCLIRLLKHAPKKRQALDDFARGTAAMALARRNSHLSLRALTAVVADETDEMGLGPERAARQAQSSLPVPPTARAKMNQFRAPVDADNCKLGWAWKASNDTDSPNLVAIALLSAHAEPPIPQPDGTARSNWPAPWLTSPRPAVRRAAAFGLGIRLQRGAPFEPSLLLELTSRYRVEPDPLVRRSLLVAIHRATRARPGAGARTLTLAAELDPDSRARAIAAGQNHPAAEGLSCEPPGQGARWAQAEDGRPFWFKAPHGCTAPGSSCKLPTEPSSSSPR